MGARLAGYRPFGFHLCPSQNNRRVASRTAQAVDDSPAVGSQVRSGRAGTLVADIAPDKGTSDKGKGTVGIVVTDIGTLELAVDSRFERWMAVRITIALYHPEGIESGSNPSRCHARSNIAPPG